MRLKNLLLQTLFFDFLDTKLKKCVLKIANYPITKQNIKAYRFEDLAWK